MNTVKILKRGPVSRTGVYDAAVTINSKDCGVLYLNETEKEILRKLLQEGLNNENTELEFDLYPEDSDDNL